MILLLIYIFHLTAVWTGSGATFTAGNHIVMDMSMKHPPPGFNMGSLQNFYAFIL